MSWLEETGTANLEKVDHIVVLMMENRSFDHMLGYLSLEGGRSDVDGLREGLANEHQGRSYPISHLSSTVIAEDPDHTAKAVDLQIGDGKMDGFVASYAATMESRGVENGDPAPIMGYYNAADVPVYDHLASEFATCDRWFSSVPGATWPNRLYALCGRAAGSRDCHPHNLPPLYDQPSFVRHLDEHGVSWRWYSSDIGTLRMADQLYCLGHHDRFAYFTKSGLPWKTRLNLRVQSEDASFLEDAARGTLPSVSWIDPNWGNFNPFGFEQNDDHPPADISDGQELVLAVYHAPGGGSPRPVSWVLVVYGKDEGFCGDSGAAEAFAECLVCGGRLPGQDGDLRDGLVVSRGPGQQVKIPVIQPGDLQRTLPVEPGGVSYADLPCVALQGAHPGSGGLLGEGQSAPVGLQHGLGHRPG